MVRKNKPETAETILDIDLSSDQKQVVVARNRTVDIYETSNLRQILSIKTDLPPTKVGFSSNDRFIIYVTNDQKISVVELKTGKSYELINKSRMPKEEFADEGAWGIYDNYKYYYDRITAIAFSETETLLATVGHSTMGMKGNLLSKMPRDECIEYSESLPEISVFIWDLNTKSIKHILTGHEGGIGSYVEGMAYSRDSRHLVSWGPTGVHSQSVLIWNVLDGRLLHQLKFKEYDIGQIIFSSDDRQFAVVGDMAFHLADLITGRFISTIPFPANECPQWVMKGHECWREIEQLKKSVETKLTKKNPLSSIQG